MMMTSFVYRDFCSSSQRLSVFLVIFVAGSYILKLSTNLTEGAKFSGKGDKRSCIFTILALECVFFSNMAHMDFMTGRMKVENVRARVVKASVNEEDLVHFSRFPSNMSSNVLR